jgi:predicted ATPase/DNA-binding SARP family transcriptional activator
MEFRILGPVEVADGGSLIALPEAQRALLAVLLLSANEVVSSDGLIEALWEEHSPESGRTALQVRVSQLRKGLRAGGALVVTRPPGYVLQVDADQVDLGRFERLVAEAEEADPSAAAVKLREALALWRGPALADLAFESFAQPAIARLEELRLGAVEKRIDADLALGRHAALVGELEALAAEHPLREHVRAQLMLALYRCGRQADALSVYQSARRELVEELGIEPSPSLRKLERSILRQDSALEPPPPAPAPWYADDVSASMFEPRHNLPAPISSFVGRERELHELHWLLSHTRALTLVGAGGVGKTRLALELAELVLEGWGDGVWFVDLAPLVDPALVAATAASVFAVPEAPGRSASESLVDALRSRELVVILDNCEHVIESAAILAGQLVTGCPRVAVVSTSREPLRIAGEQIYRVPSLSLPGGEGRDIARAADSEAVRLFVDRARQQRPDFALDSNNCDAVARLCRRLDGIPLAIELAAARLRAMSVHEIEKRLDQRFAFLTGGNRAALPRQQTLEALIDWSYDLLDPTEQELLERLSVFAGGFDLDSADLVTVPWQHGSVFDEVLALVDKSLVQWNDSNNRYRLLESVRDYAAGKLLARGNVVAEAVRTAHRDYYLGLAEAAAPHLRGTARSSGSIASTWTSTTSVRRSPRRSTIRIPHPVSVWPGPCATSGCIANRPPKGRSPSLRRSTDRMPEHPPSSGVERSSRRRSSFSASPRTLAPRRPGPKKRWRSLVRLATSTCASKGYALWPRSTLIKVTSRHSSPSPTKACGRRGGCRTRS